MSDDNSVKKDYDSLKKTYANLVSNRTFRSTFDRSCLNTTYYNVNSENSPITNKVTIGTQQGQYDTDIVKNTINATNKTAKNNLVITRNEKILKEYSDSMDSIHSNFDSLIGSLAGYLAWVFRHRYYDKATNSFLSTHFFSVHSTYRAPTYNSTVSQSSSSDHVFGRAADIGFRQFACDEILNVIIGAQLLPGNSTKAVTGNLFTQIIVYVPKKIVSELIRLYPDLVKNIINRKTDLVKSELEALMKTPGSSKYSVLQELCLKNGFLSPIEFIHFGYNPGGSDHIIYWDLGLGKNPSINTSSQPKEEEKFEESSLNKEALFDREYYYNKVLK